MDYLSWMLTFTVVGYATVLSVKTGVPLLHYHKAKGRAEKIDGEISSFFGEECVGKKNKKVNSFYPTYSCSIDGKKKVLNGFVRYIGKGEDNVGKKVILLYDSKTGELWCEQDLPLMKRQIVIRLLVTILLLGLMILTSIML